MYESLSFSLCCIVVLRVYDQVRQDYYHHNHQHAAGTHLL